MAQMIQVILLLMITAATAKKCSPDSEYVRALTYLRPGTNSSDNKVRGTVSMVQAQRGGPTFFRIKISGVNPNSAHGFHIHQYGDIISKGCTSAGAHYNPFSETHGAPKDKVRHVGDLGNVYSDKHGNVQVIKKDYLVSLVGEYSIIGRSIVLHGKRDDLGRGSNIESKRTGNAGARIACGVIVHAEI